MRRTGKRPVVTGEESLIGNEAEVVSKLDLSNLYTVRMQGELWTAHADDSIQVGETVTVLSVEGNTLRVKRKNYAVK